MERKSIYILMHIYMLKINNNIYNLRIFIDFPIKFQKQNAISFYLREINNFRKNYQEYRDVKVLTTEIKVGGDDEEIREDDGDTDHEDEARLHESLQRGLLHAATLSSCIPPPALMLLPVTPPLSTATKQPGARLSWQLAPGPLLHFLEILRLETCPAGGCQSSTSNDKLCPRSLCEHTFSNDLVTSTILMENQYSYIAGSREQNSLTSRFNLQEYHEMLNW